MNTPTRRWASAWAIKHLQLQLGGMLLEGEDAATLLDAIHSALQQSAWKRFGSADLEAVADTIRSECELFAEQETEIHEFETLGEKS